MRITTLKTAFKPSNQSFHDLIFDAVRGENIKFNPANKNFTATTKLGTSRLKDFKKLLDSSTPEFRTKVLDILKRAHANGANLKSAFNKAPKGSNLTKNEVEKKSGMQYLSGQLPEENMNSTMSERLKEYKRRSLLGEIES